MKTGFIPLLTAATLSLAAISSHAAGDVLPLAQKQGCTTCHDITTKIVGPAFVDVANKYRGNPDALKMLMKKVKEGGKGVWGRIPMPAHPETSDEDLKTLVTWVLSH